MVHEKVDATGRRLWLVASMGLAGLLMVAAPWVAWAQTSPATTAAQSSNERGVTVKVTAKSIGLPGRQWEFDVVLDTHSADLSDDLAQSANLTTDDGRTFKPTGWLGATGRPPPRRCAGLRCAGAAPRCDRTPDRPAGRIRFPHLSLATLKE